MKYWGIDSSRMTTDSGIDLVAYSSKNNKAFTIQVKTKEKPTGAGGKGKMALGWFLRNDSPAELVALVDLDTEQIWLFTIEEFRVKAQQKSGKNIMQLYMYTEKPTRTKHQYSSESDFQSYLLKNRVFDLLLQ
jgi:hypothetical protein